MATLLLRAGAVFTGVGDELENGWVLARDGTIELKVIKPGWGFSFDYQPGQYIGIGVLVDGRWRWRSYSLTSSPVTSARIITITVKAMPDQTQYIRQHVAAPPVPGLAI